MNRFKLLGGERRHQPVKDRIKNRAGVIGGKRISRQRENESRPKQRRPPRTQPRRQKSFRWHALADFVQLRRWARIPPRLFGQFSFSLTCRANFVPCRLA